MNLGELRFKEFLKNTNGLVGGDLLQDAKNRWYSREYTWEEDEHGNLLISPAKGGGDTVKIPSTLSLDESLVAFFGLYSGDGAKGSEDRDKPGKVKTQIAFSQKEPNLVRFAMDQFRKIFSDTINFVFSLGEDSAYFMDEKGLELLHHYYEVENLQKYTLAEVKKELDEADKRYLSEKRPVNGLNEEFLAFHYQHKEAMQKILSEMKKQELIKVGITLNPQDRVTASLRRPFKKGARKLGGTSRSDELYVGGLKGFGEFFLKVLHEIEDSILKDSKSSSQGLVVWRDIPSKVGERLDVKQFFTNSPYGELNSKRPSIKDDGVLLKGKWPVSSEVSLNPYINIDPLWCYTSGLYLAEGSTAKHKLFSMYFSKVEGLALSFTSSENISLELMLRTLEKLFPKDKCLHNWKVKVGSQYFPELVMIGLKHGVPMLRGGKSGDGKMRTMEISLAIKEWALNVAPCLVYYENKYSHVEPTGAGLARIDFSSSSAMCKWYFPLLMYSVFGNLITNPKVGFNHA
ncbi:hypothetical protein [Priestia aryabhattai]|uniref:hypothetical protein n=1 Tax=Priestia aryabhattai TaxID=412384 RepID=UPI002657F338|nr:hypothetical protein [Priestia aryabhattai]WKG33409.1 hypothetical protein QYS54_26550 [Priestia aryabhattai]